MLNNKQKKRRLYISKLDKVIPKKERFNFSIKDVKNGSYICIDEQNFVVLSIGTYLETKWKNFKRKKEDYIITELKLFSLSTAEISYIEWEEDDEIEAYQTIKEIKINELKSNGSSISKNLIEKISDEEQGSVQYNNKSYYYDDEDTYAALYTNEKYSESKVKVYGFANDLDEYISIEFWYDDNDDSKPQKEVYLSKELNLNKLSVLQI